MAFDEKGARLELSARDEPSATGVLKRQGRLRFSFSSPVDLPARGAIELEYVASGEGLDWFFSVPGQPSWKLPANAAPLGLENPRATLRYRLPMNAGRLESFAIEAKRPAGQAPVGGTDAPALSLKSISVTERVYGFAAGKDVIFLSPFVFAETDNGGFRCVIDPPAEYALAEPVGVSILPTADSSTLQAGGAKFACFPQIGGDGPQAIRIPAGALPPEIRVASFESSRSPRAFLLRPDESPAEKGPPIAADPGVVLSYRREAWRNARFEYFKWDRFPSVVIFDTADYAVQDRLFKRLAFFVEKAGFRGKLATAEDMAALHGWNAHDYRAEDLAVFFETARRTGFSLNADERELRRILLSAGVIREESGSGAVHAGLGAVISISRESTDYLRTLFMAHEAWHGIFFIDEDFRRFSQDRYENLGDEAKRFLLAYFDSRRYDTADPYLMKNELMAYCLQQRLSLVARYFGDNLPTRLEKDPARKRFLPPRDESGKMPFPTLAQAFVEESRLFDEYAAARWGLRAGRVASIYQISFDAAAR